MAAFALVLLAVSMGVSGAPPAPPRHYQQHAPAQLQQVNTLDYYLEHPELHNYYNQAQQTKQGHVVAHPNQPARLENLEPDSEVELLPGAQAPQQPPQQTPVAPNVPGLIPGQRVFIVHMPVPGYRPGTIGGYQPVYIVAAAPQGNPGYSQGNPGYAQGNPGYAQANPGYAQANPAYAQGNPGYLQGNPGYPGNGYQQNTIFLDPSSGQVVSPLGYPRGVQGLQGTNPGLLLGSPLLNRPYDLGYQDPGVQYLNQHILQGADGKGSVQLAQLVALQQHPVPLNPRPANENASAEQKQSQSIVESKETNEEPRRNVRPGPHAPRAKA